MTMIMKAIVLALAVIFLLDHVRESSALSIQDGNQNMRTSGSRRGFVKEIILTTTTAASVLLLPEQAHATRAVGVAEEKCRAAGNCLEKLDLDGAVGWSWGAKDRCDASDPNCGSDGKLRDAPLIGENVPDTLGCPITHIVEMSLAIGRSDEDCTIRMGLYGNDGIADSVKEFLELVSPSGITTTSKLMFENGVGIEAMPVSLSRGGILSQIVPGELIDFGIPLQSNVYARSKRLSKAGENFRPQPRPKALNGVPVLRKHDVAGLISIPGKGVGYGGTGYESDDACFESSFQITAKAIPAMDKEGRRVIGQVLDEQSMANLARVASLPVKKGFRGVIPGQKSGPPLQKVVLSGLDVRKVKSEPETESAETNTETAES